jgi:CBS domain containing-hemolysin-like protein
MPDPLSVHLLSVSAAIPTFSSWIVVILCLITIGFFSGMEIAFISANKLRIELRSKQGVFGGKWVAKYIKEPNEFISTVLVATNLALVIYGIAMGDILQYYLSIIVSNALAKFILTTMLSTVIVLITAEYIPKTIFRLQADTLLFVFVVPFRVAHLILWPLISFTKGASTTLLSLFTQTDNTTQTKVFSKVDLDEFISSIESSKDMDAQELDTEAFRNALEFSEVDVREIMVPRKELVGLEINTSIDELTQTFIETSLSRILIYRENIDNIIGFVHHSDLFHQPEKLNEILHPVIITSENTEAQQLLRRFIFERKSLAVVVDEFGGTAGIATVEDLVEEIFGEIKDEFDTEDAFELQLGDNHYRFAARLEIDYLNEKYGFDFKEGDYTTLGGYIIFYAERIPELNETLRFENLEFHITKIDGARIEEVELKRF